MYRQSFAPPPAQSPPLHHPVPQHVSTVPMMRSPPPPSSQQSQNSNYGNPYQPAPAQGGSGTYAPGFGGFMNEPTAQMGFQVGKTAMAAGQEYMEQNVSFSDDREHGYISAVLANSLNLPAQPLCFHPRSKALLQCLQLLRFKQTRPSALPMATQAMVSSASPSHDRVHGPQWPYHAAAILVDVPSPSR